MRLGSFNSQSFRDFACALGRNRECIWSAVLRNKAEHHYILPVIFLDYALPNILRDHLLRRSPMGLANRRHYLRKSR